MKAWLFPNSESNSDISEKEEETDEGSRAEHKEGVTDMSGDYVMGGASVKQEAMATEKSAITLPIVVQESATISLKYACTNMVCANGRLISCGREPHSFIHWNFVRTFISFFADFRLLVLSK